MLPVMSPAPADTTVPNYAVAIIGGGMTGLSMLRALPEYWREQAILLDAAPPPASNDGPPGLDDRGTALNRRSLETLAGWGCLDSTLEQHLGPIRHIEVSQQGYWGLSSLSAEDAEPALGAVAPNRLLGQALLRMLQGSAAEIRYQVQVAHLETRADHVRLHLQDDSQLTAQLVILADGGRSDLGHRLGLQGHRHDYRQVAFTLNIERERAAEGWAYERFSKQGPRALLPLAGRRQTVVWVVPHHHSEATAQWSDATWREQLEQCFGFDQGRITALSARAHYPLSAHALHEQFRPRLAVIGNGALTLHPVAGQGFNLHLRSLTALGQALNAVTDPGDTDLLRHWADSVRPDQTRVAAACHGLVSLFAPELSPLAHLRGLGLQTLNALPGVRHRLMQRAMGYH
ncbi:hypothetical protein E4656_12825 [Natronospirillum operosum]|uniref:FAD-binding domain-containing protein n=2 Tax=Natronospirillum operosum TaxID=2759953 RepID=A0A4Z0W9Y1_9GAMM|nr:hypothetical protein E4656_12825 [Natronospirillum operosum]